MCTRATCAALKALAHFINLVCHFFIIYLLTLYLIIIILLYFYRKAATMVDAATMEKMEAGFSKLQASDSKSLLKKYLTKEVFDALKNKKTSFGSTLLDCIQSGG